jgi:phenylacetate-CoA ligase
MHMMGEDYCFRYDLRDPETKEPLPLVDGAVGEAIHTGLEYEAGPALRYATGDIVRIHVGHCPGDGIFGTRMQIIGRVDDLLMVKGVKVYPASIKEVLESFQPDVSGEMRIDLDRAPPKVEPPLRLTVEAGSDLHEADRAALASRIAERMHQLLAVRPQITIVAFGSLPRSSLKTKLIHVREETAA